MTFPIVIGPGAEYQQTAGSTCIEKVISIIGDVLEENWRKTGGSLVQLPREYLAVTSQLPRSYLAVTVRLPRGYPALAPFRLPQGVPWLPPMLLLNYP